ncbi:NAD-dependent deacylase [Kyrpidia spormannii]|uniref:NAD-dependent protein deacetylase n=2 Tax=Kyrpidia spormannii TaxID=2055160 RepID=A0ACA8ZC40_9BACL|nr:NAD-dependent deacylase [Kyrpidia spormannii]CAB3394620.1 NAD-dependent protein deacetylase [Kyrpidia spormannii]CAB3395593.1 NAD-dependent protein deacetylase [Kyrpidia spormannii]
MGEREREPRDNGIRRVAQWLRKARRAVALTGAGMSTESGIPDFRSQGGLWAQVDPREVATVEALETNYPRVREFYRKRIDEIKKHRPHLGHEILARWEKAGRLQAVATQNIDGFHQMAGSRVVHELHGSLRRFHCLDCGQPATEAEFLGGEPCPHCRGRLRPGVVMFGELLPMDAWNAAETAMRAADLVLVIGTSLEVYPVNQLPALSQGKRVLINLESTDQQALFDEVLIGRAGEVLAAIDREMGNQSGDPQCLKI